eukprot:578511-Pleurochrysis_carterae.AAC.1
MRAFCKRGVGDEGMRAFCKRDVRDEGMRAFCKRGSGSVMTTTESVRRGRARGQGPRSQAGRGRG